MSVTEGNLLINTTTDNGQTLQANGTAYITGNVGIGITPSAIADEKLRVNGLVRARKVIVTLNGWGDYVFDSTYRLKLLPEVADYIQQHHHLPEMPTAAHIEKEGLDLGSVVKQQQVKIEELTLYILSQAKKQEALQQEILALQQLLAEKEGKAKATIVKP